MLVRAARRKARPLSTRIQSSPEQSYLPWLYPAPRTIQTNRRRWATFDAGSQGPEIRKRRNSNDGANVPSRRSMATVLGSMPMDDIPFESMLPPSDPYAYLSMTRGQTAKGGPFSLLDAMEMTNLYRDEDVKIKKTGNTGVGGDLSEFLSIYHACLQVGNINRAAVILKRILPHFANDPDEQALLHTQYLRASVEHIIVSPKQSARQAIHRWFELEIRLKHIPYDVPMVAYMLKASLQSPDDVQGGNRKRLVRRYMALVDYQGGLEILDMDILSAEEKNQINHICPSYNLAHSPEVDFEEIRQESLAEDLEKVIDEGAQAEPDPSQGEKVWAEVRPVLQKGQGLKALKKSLSLFANNSGVGLDFINKSAAEKRQAQAQLEEDAVNSAIDRWRDESNALKKMGMDSSLQTKSLGARMWKWQTALEQYLKDELVKVREAEEKEGTRSEEEAQRCLHGPFLRILPPEKLAAVTILTVMGALGIHGVEKGLRLSGSIMQIAGAVEDESIFEMLQQNAKRGVWAKNSAEKTEFENLQKMARTRGAGSAAKIVATMRTSEEPGSITWKQWPLSMKARVGAFLMSALIEVAKVPVSLEHAETKQIMTQLQPAFTHGFRYRMGKRFGVVHANKSLAESLRREPVHSLLAKHLPMLVEPDPWTLFNKGGFLVHPSKLMRVKLGDKSQRHYAEAALSQGDLTALCRGLDVLGKTEWNINQPVFEVMLEAWNSGEAVGNLAPDSPKLQIPPEIEGSRDPLERRRWIRAVKAVENTRTGLHSQRCFQNFQLEIARALRNETFYFPHNVDFRGRAYPIPPYLNHMGADHCRGILKFGKGKELGTGGLRWLKIHLANVFGFDKASLSEREQFADKHIKQIYDSATRPLNGSRWWLEGEDPWQCLAACMELRSALESPDPTRFVSNLPCHQDGTCNGLQHYAALGGDSWGAKQVNLEPGDRPADVYTAVANLVKESIDADLKLGHPLARTLEGKVTRKTVKQTVMTNVYGVTFIGARDQVKKALNNAYSDLPNTLDDNPQILASYVAQKIFQALGSMFGGAQDIQYWFGECAARVSACLTPEQIDRLQGEWPRLLQGTIASNENKFNLDDAVQFKTTVIWTTPLHMPVVQPYRTSKLRTVQTRLQSISLQEPHRSHAVSKRKQLQGFPPNFIHSLDATHMLLSALKCDELGLTFAAVHDSFWTHASDIDTMNGVLRDAFIKIHSEDVIGRLAAEFEARYRNCIYLAQLSRTSPAAVKIMEWRKKNLEGSRVPKAKKAPRLKELLLERRRMNLLNSSDPEEVAEGRQMVTPASIFEEFSADSDLEADPELKNLALGAIPSKTRVEAAEAADEKIAAEDVDEVVEPGEVEGGNDGEGWESEAVTSDEMGTFEKRLNHKSTKVHTKVPVWLPMKFPRIPKKGEFDVSRLKESQYFFS